MIYIAKLNKIQKHRRLYIYQTYVLPIILYGSCTFLANKLNKDKMRRNVQFQKLNAIHIKELKNALGLPKRGKVGPIFDMFPNFTLENLIINNYLRNTKLIL